jgi:hypothetical protein
VRTLTLRNLTLTNCKCGTSEEGGAACFYLPDSCLVSLANSTISSCSASESNGRGGGFYFDVGGAATKFDCSSIIMYGNNSRVSNWSDPPQQYWSNRFR